MSKQQTLPNNQMTNEKTLIENLCMDKELKQPKRHTAAGEGVVRTDEKGILILLSDYEKLLRFTAILDRHEEVQYKQREAFEKLCKELKAQVVALIKAGDLMDAYLKRQDGTTNGMLDCRQRWNAAKEGKPDA